MKRQRRKARSGQPPEVRSGSALPAVSARTRARVWAFRAGAMLGVPLGVLVGFEVVLRVAGVGYPTSFLLAAQIQDEPCHIENAKFGWRFFGPRMARTPPPVAIPDAKPANTCRVFVLGESAAYGDPQPAFGLARHLEVLLRERLPGTRFEVVNAAMTAINSHAILPIARDCARRDGDVWVVYLGNNEVVGPFGAGTVFGPQASGLASIRASLALKTTRTGQFLERIGQWLRPPPELAGEWGGMRMFLQHQVPADAPRLAKVYAHFEQNLADILRTGRQSGARVILSTVASNLRDCAPFASRHGSGLAPTDLEEWERWFQAGVAAQAAGQTELAAGHFRAAAEWDDRFAELHFRWGQCCLALQQYDQARHHFARARDEDTLRFRCDTRLNEIVRRTAQGRESEGVFFVDGEDALARLSPDGLPGAEWFYEHVHLRFEGNYQLARCLADQVARALPERFRTNPSRDWLALDECARQLGWTDWSRYEGVSQMLGRLAEPPFSTQSNHDAQVQRLRRELAGSTRDLKRTVLEEAVGRLREQLARTPNDTWLLETLARGQLQLGDLEAAADSWSRVLRRLPHSLDARGQHARILALRNRPDEARRAFQWILRQDPDSILARDGLAHVSSQQQDFAAAMAEHERILRRRPQYSPSHIALGMLLVNLGRTNEARNHYREAAEHPLNTAPALRAAGLVCVEQGWLAEAMTNLTRSLGLDPTDPVTHLQLGQVLAAQRRSAEAAAAYAEALRWDPGFAEAHFRLGFELGRQGQDTRALEHFAEAVRLDPELVPARLNLGIATLRHGRTNEAQEHFAEVLRREPTNAVARMHLRNLGEPPAGGQRIPLSVGDSGGSNP